MKGSLKSILEELALSVSRSSLEGHAEFLNLFEKDGSKIICTGAGRVGLAMRGFAMRLMHLGFDSHFLGETIVPNLGSRDLLLVGSGSGSTKSILTLVEIAKAQELRIGLITATKKSPMRELATAVVELHSPNKYSDDPAMTSIQPMTTLFEQTLSIYLDATVLDLMQKFGESSASMWARHNSIE